MVWKSNHGSHDKNAAPTYYQRLMPTHIISQLIHHTPTTIHNQDEQGQGDPEASTHGYSSSIQYSPAHIIVPSSEQPSESSRIAALRGTAQDGAQISYASITSGNSTIPIVNATGTSTAANPPPPLAYVHANEEEGEDEEAAGHDSPNWSKTKSFVILFGCTLLYSIIAEILVDTVDEVMKDHPMNEKFLGLTLFALVPNITEFMNAISFALYGNIVLSMEIGSAYALQVCLLQIPAMVAFSVWYNYGKEELSQFTFSLVFPRWDVISVIFSVFLLTYTYQEGKANYFKGSILVLSYVVLIAGFYFIPSFSEHSVLIGAPSFSN
jgi:Ca2+:H+ antiporter